MDDSFSDGERAASPIFNFEPGSSSQSNSYTPIEPTLPALEIEDSQQQQPSILSGTKGLLSPPPSTLTALAHQMHQTPSSGIEQPASSLCPPAAGGHVSTTNHVGPVSHTSIMNFMKKKMAKRHEELSKARNKDSSELFSNPSRANTSNHMKDEDAWMYGDDDDKGDENSAELADLLAKRNILKTQNRKSRLTAEKLAEMLRLDEEIAKQERRNRKIDEDDEKGMFVSEDENSIFSSCDEARSLEDFEDQEEDMETSNRSDHNEDTALLKMLKDDVGDETPNIKPTPKKPRRKAALNAREVNKRRQEEALKRKLKQDQKARKSKKQLPKKTPTKKRKAPDAGKGGKGKKQKNSLASDKSHTKNSRENGDPLEEMLWNLRNNNPILDRANQADYGPEPQIQSRNKVDQLALILGSVPSDYDTHKAKTDKKELLQASKNFGRGQVKAYDGMWQMKGMHKPLYHYQLLGVEWMVNRELSNSGPKGGIVADSMGLGKTVQLLATMVMNPPTPEHIQKKIKSTLIVVPASLIHQWRVEISNHADIRRISKVNIYRSIVETELPVLKECDVVLTTYAEIMKSYPYPSTEEQKEMNNEAKNDWISKNSDKKGNLHKMKWYRVVLDEAHQIKNYMSRTTLACLDLDSEYRWALSGTPLQNRITELYPYLRFLRSEMTTSMPEFKKYYQNDGNSSYARINVALSIVMIRRTIKDKMFGRPIINLPKTIPSTDHIEFSKEEEFLYRLVEDRFRAILNQHLMKGTAEKNYNLWMVQLLRLRQATAHPFLLEPLVRSLLTAEDLLSLQKQIKRLEQDSTPIYEQIKQWVKSTPHDSTNQDMENAPFGVSSFGKDFNLGPYLENLGDDDYTDRVCCRLCGDFVQNARKIACGHIFCGECIISYINLEVQQGFDIYTCPECRKTFIGAEPFNFGNPIDEERSESPGVSGFSKGKDYNNIEPRSLKSSWLERYDQDSEKYELVPSAKSIAIKSVLCHWFHTNPNDKVIIFVQWKLMARILGRMCNAEHYDFVYYTGDMNAKSRVEAVKVFHENPRVKIMIAGLKCGGQGLNLTCANRVISVDLWWNHSVEQQAFGRVFRIGQTKETHLKRLVIRNTVDCRILDIQADKIKVLDRAMQDTGESIEPLSMTELANLFGFVRKDENGIIQVYPDYKDAPEAPDYQS